jgi:hypothetical protein
MHINTLFKFYELLLCYSCFGFIHSLQVSVWHNIEHEWKLINTKENRELYRKERDDYLIKVNFLELRFEQKYIKRHTDILGYAPKEI